MPDFDVFSLLEFRKRTARSHGNGHCKRKSRVQKLANCTLRPDFTSKLVHVLAFGIPKIYIAPYDKIQHELFTYFCINI